MVHNNESDYSFERVLRHISFVKGPRPDDCNGIHLVPDDLKCEFVRSTPSCAGGVFYLDYTNYLYCTIGAERETCFKLGFALLVILLLLCFTILGTTADQFFCPVLAVISNTLKISESVAGVTILAFGNGSPDIFTSLSHPDSDTEMMFGELLGAALFVIGIVAGTVLLIQPFHISPFGIVRDTLIFIFVVGWVTGCAYDERFKLYDAIVVLAVYGIFLVIVLGEFISMKKRLAEVGSSISLHGDLPMEDSHYKELRNETVVVIKPRRGGERDEVDVQRNRVSVFRQGPFGVSPNYRLFSDFCDHLRPINKDEWQESGAFKRAITVMQTPVLFVLNLLIPTVDYTIERHGWCKLLNMLHCLTLPLTMLLIDGFFFTTLWDVPLWRWWLLVAAVLLTTIFFTSRTDRPPFYHLAYAAMVFVGSIHVIYIVAQEVVSLLATMGLVMKLSRSMIGLSVLAWGNSVGDLFSNITLAKQGYGKMAFAACLGGPLFNLCLGLGIALGSKALKTKEHVAISREGAMSENCEAFLIQLLATLLLALLLTDFQGRRSIGLIMIIIYLVFIVFCLLGELEIIHPYGTDHYPNDEPSEA
ncbi:mitochondrial sodium/calcium exchanger protein-like isoform X2 [Uranotaenia lowii]|uniref:mitochondrial sodium/calcium exchanger protein-like isoform X2 n=1 Tax=Uranotaenia lowii TaxID=190385 RepID=UPI00247850F7|nr:mitochondrial sodium/calcium exchanger protein-like isoform X2 [Uranotaenia lowii]